MDRKCLFTITTALWCLPIVISSCNNPRCLTCRADGYCLSCAPGFGGLHCLYKCPDKCVWEAGCTADSNIPTCLKCNIGWYGPECQLGCGYCQNEQCDLRKCSTGCKDGYYEDNSQVDVSYCYICPQICKTCSNYSFCNECNSGHYIVRYTYEGEIRQTCFTCSFNVQNCVDCTNDNNQFVCTKCVAGYYVHNNLFCVKTVPCTNCPNGCDLEGRCTGDCQAGLYGPLCNNQCNFACKSCINQDTCLSCQDGLYTQTCNVSCNANCRSSSNSTCRFVDGYCVNGCNKGFWGDQCENNCNNNCLEITSASELCHRNGTCYYGCKSGYMGSDCSRVSSTSTSLVSSIITTRASTAKLEDMTTSATPPLNQTKSDVNATEANVHTVSDFHGSLGPVIGGSIAGAFVLGVLAVVAVYYLPNRILQKQKDRTQSKNVYYNVSMSASHENRHQDSKNLASASRQCEATLYDKLSERNKGNLYDHLEQPSGNEIRQEIAELGSSVEYYNN